MGKKQQKKRDSGSDGGGDDEVDNMVGFRGKPKLIYDPNYSEYGSETNLDCVDGAISSIENRHSETFTENDSGVLFKNAMGNRDEPARELDNDNTEELQPYPFNIWLLLGSIVSLLLFIADVVTDILLAMEYRNHDRILEFALTSSVVIASFLVTGTLSTIWYVQDAYGPKDRVKKIIFLIAVFPFSIIYRNLSYLKHGCLSRKSRKKFEHYKQMIKDDRDVSLLRMFDSFIESAPQLIIQIYIAIHHKSQESLHLEILRAVTIASSLAGLSWSVTSYYRNLRIFSATSGTKANTLCGAVGYFLWRVFEIGPRITAIVMLLSVDTYGLMIIFGSIIHCFIMLTIAFLKNVKVYDKTVHNILFLVFISLVQIISYMNLSRRSSRLVAIAYYVIYYAENVTMVILFVVWTNMDKSSWLFIVTVSVASSGILFCTLFMVMYYKLCHPKVSMFSKDVPSEVELDVQS